MSRLVFSFLLLVGGALVGLGATAFQIQILRYGALAPDALALLAATFAAVGAVVSLGAGSLARGPLRRGRGFAFGLGLGTVLLLAAFGAPLNRRPLPNVILLVTDTTRADHLSLYGYERSTTPHLEEFAKSAVVFQQSVSQGSHTIVSTPSILTSTYPSEHGMKFYHHVLPGRLRLVSEYLKDHGYRTFGYATNPHLGPERGYAQGFDRYEHNPRWEHTPARSVNQRFLSWFEEGDARPAFGFLFYIDPHNPYVPPDEFARRFDPDWKGDPVSNWEVEWDPEERAAAATNLEAQYDAAIAYWDAEFSAFVGALRERGAFENTVLIYTSDHGEEFWEHGNWGHNRTLFDESVRVPLVLSLPVPLRWPPLPRPTGEVTEVVSGVDVLPTLLEYLRIPADDGLQGRSALSLALGGEDAGRYAYLEEILGQYGPYDIRAVRTRDLKYIRVLEYEGQGRSADKLFDLREDPEERHNAIDKHPEEAKRLRAVLERNLAARRGDGRENPSAPIEPAARERLKALGYIDD